MENVLRQLSCHENGGITSEWTTYNAMGEGCVNLNPRPRTNVHQFCVVQEFIDVHPCTGGIRVGGTLSAKLQYEVVFTVRHRLELGIMETKNVIPPNSRVQ